MGKTMKYKGYYATIEYSNEDNIFYGVVQGINDMVSFEGESVFELEADFHDAVDDYLRVCKEIGKEPNKPYNGSFNIRIPKELHRMVAEKAADEGITLNEYIKRVLEDSLKEKKLVPPVIDIRNMFGQVVPAISANHNWGKKLPFRYDAVNEWQGRGKTDKEVQ